jgi:hypothetical protein
MTKEFIPYEQALELKELGFDEPCLAYYNINDELTFTIIVSQNTNSFWLANPNNIISAPLYQQAFRWLHEQLDMKGVMPTTDLDYRLQMLNNLIKMLSSKKKKYA